MQNRIIKFRAWETKEKRMLDVPKLEFRDNTGTITVPVISTIGFDYVMVNGESCELMQFTGLLDKNGKEIYEGDVFPCLYAFDGCIEHVMKVEYNVERAGFFPRWDYAKCHQKNVQKTMHDLTNLEIIGNIYENPELLK